MTVSESGLSIFAPVKLSSDATDVLEAKEQHSIASINEHRKQERDRVCADQVQKV